MIFEWVSDCYLTPREQISSYIITRTTYIQWNGGGSDDGDVRFVPDQNTSLGLYSANSLKQESVDTWYWFRANQYLLLPFETVSLREEKQLLAIS